jgi:exonuclease VII small subunit
MREVKSKADIYEGEGLERRSKQELQQAQKQLSEVLKIVNQLIK